jgi:hypothetical protein
VHIVTPHDTVATADRPNPPVGGCDNCHQADVPLADVAGILALCRDCNTLLGRAWRRALVELERSAPDMRPWAVPQ